MTYLKGNKENLNNIIDFQIIQYFSILFLKHEMFLFNLSLNIWNENVALFFYSIYENEFIKHEPPCYIYFTIFDNNVHRN